MIIGSISSKVMLVLGVAATLAACLLAFMWWKAQPAVAVTDPGKIVFSSDRNYSFFDNRYDIYIMNPDGSDVQRIVRSGTESYPVLSPDGSKIAFQGDRSGTGRLDIFVMNVDGSGEVNVSDTPDLDEAFPSWSPNGSRVAFQGQTGASWDIFTANADGSGQPANLTNTDNEDEHTPAWSPDGTKLAFSALNDAGSTDIYTINADGSGQRELLTNTPEQEYYPWWSPDGSKIAYTRNDPPHYEGNIYTMNADGSNQTPVVTDPGYQYLPSWSPDGTQLVFTTNSSVYLNDLEIVKVNADGSNPVNLTDNPANDQEASWGSSYRASETPQPLSWSGILQPINGGTTLNDYADDTSVFKRGSTVLVKFELTGDGALITDATAKLSVAKVSNNVVGTESEATSTAAPTTGNLFRYDTASGQYVFNWGTKGLEAGSYQLRVDLGDNSTNTVRVSLK